MKETLSNSVIGLCLCFSLLAIKSEAAVTYWDPTGTTASSTPSGTWENSAWDASGTTLTASPIAWVPGNAAGFAAGTSATGTYTVTINNAESVAGMFNGGLSDSTGTVIITGTGSIALPTTAGQGFYTASGGNTQVLVPITGSPGIVTESSGQLSLYGTNTFTGGTSLGYSTVSFTGIINFNNSASFGTGPIIMTNGSGSALAVGVTTAVTIPNAVVMQEAATTLNLVGNSAGVTFSGPWNLVNTATIGSGNVAGNIVIISGIISGAGGLNKYNPATLTLTATNTYTGATTISNGTLALGINGSINTTPSITLVPGANGTVFDVSAISSYTLGSSSTLIGRGTGTASTTAATIKGAASGSVSLGSRPVILSFTPTAFTGDTAHPSLYVSQGSLKLSNNTFTITNAATTALGVGTYRLIQVGNGTSGTITGTPNATVSILGAGIVTNTLATLSVSNGNLNLVVKPPASFFPLTITQSNTYTIGATNVKVSGKVSSGSIYPAKGETVAITINGTTNVSSTINDTTGDFAYSFNPTAIPYSATAYTFALSYGGDASLSTATSNDVITANAFYVDSALPGFFSGENLFFTNTAGISMYTWSTTNPGLPVTDWNLEGLMQEQPLNDGTGKSRYSITVNPESPLVYYISGPSLNWPYQSPTGVEWITTDTNGNYAFFTTNISTSAMGVLGFLLPPTIVQAATNETVLVGKNANFNVLATGSQPLSYQWQKSGFNLANGGTLSGVTTNTFSVAPTALTDSGNYQVIATNNFGSVTGGVAVLDVVPLPDFSLSLGASNVTLNSTGGVAGNNYVVQVSTNIANQAGWVPLQTNVVSSNGVITFTDTNALSSNSLFYRVQFP